MTMSYARFILLNSSEISFVETEICARFYEMIIIVNKIRIKCHIRSRLCSAKSMIIAEVFLERSFNLTKKSCFKNPNPNGLIIG